MVILFSVLAAVLSQLVISWAKANGYWPGMDMNMDLVNTETGDA